MRKKVYIAYTGGTIGMKSTADGFVPAAGYLEQLMDNVPELKSDLLPEYRIGEYKPLLDSSNMTPADWLKIANDISSRHKAFDGFVVLHGTDTLAKTGEVECNETLSRINFRNALTFFQSRGIASREDKTALARYRESLQHYLTFLH